MVDKLWDQTKNLNSSNTGEVLGTHTSNITLGNVKQTTDLRIKWWVVETENLAQEAHGDF